MAEKINYTGNKLEADCYLRKIRFYSEDTNFGIAEFQVYKSTNGLLAEHFTFTCKGRMSRPKENILYTIKANEIIDPKWGLQYELTSMYTPVDMSITENIDNFMLQVLTERELEATYKVYDNPYKVWDEGDIEKLTKISGIGIKTAVRKLAEFKKVKAFQKVYVELADFNLTESMVKRLEDAYGDNPDLIISIIKENPYIMAQNVYGIGFKKCDKIALDGGMEPNSPKRISAFIRFYLTECNNNGLSWITADHLLGGIIDNLGEDVKDEAITEAIHNIDKELWYSEDHSRIGLLRYYNTEHKIAEELYRLQTAESRVKNDNWIDSVRRIERLNGWEFTDEQLKAVQMGNNSNVFVLTGGAGCVDCDTEFFTGEGWKRIADYQPGDKVLQYNEDGTAELVEPLRYIKQPKDYLWHFKTKYGLDQCLSDEHECYYITSKGNLYHKPFKEVRTNHENSNSHFSGKFVTTFNYSGGGIPLTDDEIRLAIAIFADGSFYYGDGESVTNKNRPSYNRVRFHLKKERKKKRLENLIDKCGFDYRQKCSIADGYDDYYFDSHIGRLKHFPKDWYNATRKQLGVIADEVMYWDGRYSNQNEYSTTCKEDADFIQFVFSALGQYRATIATYDRRGKSKLTNDKEYERKSIDYTVRYTKRTLVGLNGYNGPIKKESKTPIVPYKTKDGYEYCFTVPSHILVLRRNNKIFVTGNCGKTTTVQAILEANKGATLLQCSLSGKAANRMTEITGKEGFTIHRALNFPKGPKEYGGFGYNPETPLDADIVVVDEVSMIGCDLFYALIRAIPNGTKLILLGDTGQLPSIGSGNVLDDIIASGEIPTINLTKIHRQAAKSAIITESLKVRNGEQIIPKDWAGKETRGELQDLNIECYSDKSNTFYQVMERFTYEMCQPGFDIMECQIITPIKTRGDSCSQKMNLALQEMYNPAKNGVKECKVLKNGYPTIFRVGDKVINTKNNYYTRNIEGDNCPVYNGTIGIIKEIDKYGSMIVDFAYIGQVRLNRYGDKGDERDGLELGYAITVHKCVTADTWIYTNKGLKTIKELDNGALPYEFKEVDKDISVYNGEYFETPSHFYNAGISECRKVTTKRGYQLTGTLDHGLDVITTDGIIVRKDIGELTKEDYLLIRKGQGAYGTSIDIPSSWLTFSFNTRAKKYTLPTIMTEDFAYFLGGMMADGVIYKSGFRYVKNQIDPAVKMSNIIYKIFGFEPSVSRANTEFDGWYQVEVNSTYLRAFLKNVDGIQPNNKFVPQCILNAPKKIQTAFLKGAFEDGSVNLKNGKFDHIEFSQNGDGKVIKQIRMMLLNLGIVSSYKVIYSKKKNHKDKYVLYIYRKDAIIFRKEIGFTSKNKKSSLDKCMAKDIKTCSQNYLPLLKQVERLLIELKVDPRSINKNLPHYFKKGKTITDNMVESVLSYLEKNVNNSTENEMYKYINMILTNYHVESIIDIESCTEQTYCLTMPETHRFIQNGIQGWNCQGSEFKTLIFAFDFNSYTLLSKEMVYTAITRAKNMCYIICQNGALRYATAQNGIAQKQTFLQECLHDVFHPKLIF